MKTVFSSSVSASTFIHENNSSMEAHTSTVSRFQNPHRTSYPSLVPSPSHTLYPKSVSFKSNDMFSLFSNSSSPKIRFFSINSSLKLEAVTGDAKEKIAKKKLAVFVSGGGSNFKSIHQSAIRGSINGEIVVLVTNKPDCGGAEYARSNNIPAIVFPTKKQNSENLSVNNLIATLRRYEVDFILLAGYLKLIPDELVRAYPKSILNIHPSLLPAFGGKGYYGMKVHQAVIASGARYSGPTIHFVDEHYDTGRILAQRVVPVHATDTAADLAARVLQKEHELYVEVVAALCDERIAWREDGVPLIRSKENPDVYN